MIKISISFITVSAIALTALTALTANALDCRPYIKLGAGLAILSGKTKMTGYKGPIEETPNPFEAIETKGSKSTTTYGTTAEIGIG